MKHFEKLRKSLIIKTIALPIAVAAVVFAPADMMIVSEPAQAIAATGETTSMTESAAPDTQIPASAAGPSVVFADELTPAQRAQQEALKEEERVRLEQEAEAARTANAVSNAQKKAEAEEAAAVYAAWGTYGNYRSPDVIMAQGEADMFSDCVSGVLGNMTVDLVIFAGQSNMSGAGGSASSAPAVANGQGYEFKAISNPNGLYPIKEPFGCTEAGYIGENSSLKRGSLVSSFASNYYARTGVPIVAISASRGNTASSWWAQPQVISDLTSRYNKALNYLNTNHYSVRKKYLVFLQGESDSLGTTTPEQYKANINAAFSGLFNAGLDQVFIITPGRTASGVVDYTPIINAQKDMCAKSSKYTLASELLQNLPVSYMTDELHYNQKALDMVGADAAAKAAAYTVGQGT